MNKAYISSTLLMLSILFFPLLAALVFRSKANKLREQKPVLFIVCNLLVLFSPVILLEVYFFLLPKNWVPAEHSYFFLIVLVSLTVAFIVRFFVNKEQWLHAKQMMKVNRELGKVESIFGICIISTAMYPIFFMNSADIRSYRIGLLILAFWIYFIYISLIVSKKQKMDGERSE